MSWQLQKAGKNHQDGFCMACLLGQSLILDSGAVELNVSGAASYALDCLYAPVAAITGSFQSPSNRAPPTGC